MLTQEEDVEIHALRNQGWSISAIARHTGRDRKTVRAYLTGDRQAGVRVPVAPDAFDRFEPYVRQRLADDRHVWATALFDELRAMGYDPAIRRSPASCGSGGCGHAVRRVTG
jgi:transposase